MPAGHKQLRQPPAELPLARADGRSTRLAALPARLRPGTRTPATFSIPLTLAFTGQPAGSLGIFLPLHLPATAGAVCAVTADAWRHTGACLSPLRTADYLRPTYAPTVPRGCTLRAGGTFCGDNNARGDALTAAHLRALCVVSRAKPYRRLTLHYPPAYPATLLPTCPGGALPYLYRHRRLRIALAGRRTLSIDYAARAFATALDALEQRQLHLRDRWCVYLSRAPKRHFRLYLCLPRALWMPSTCRAYLCAAQT